MNNNNNITRCYSLTGKYERCNRYCTTGEIKCFQHRDSKELYWYTRIDELLGNIRDSTNPYKKMEYSIEVFEYIKENWESIKYCKHTKFEKIIFDKLIEFEEDKHKTPSSLFYLIFKEKITNYLKILFPDYGLKKTKMKECCVCYKDTDTTNGCCNYNTCETCYKKMDKCPICRKFYYLYPTDDNWYISLN